MKKYVKIKYEKIKHLSWVDISQEKLSEDFIREFQDKVDWENISIYQKKINY
jgi:hypothetical protein